MVFTGYAEDGRIIRYWDQASRRILTTRDMIFEEESSHTTVTPMSQPQGERAITQQQQQNTPTTTPLTPLTPTPPLAQPSKTPQTGIESVTGYDTQTDDEPRKSDRLKQKKPIDYAKLHTVGKQKENDDGVTNIAYDYVLLGQEQGEREQRAEGRRGGEGGDVEQLARGVRVRAEEEADGAPEVTALGHVRRVVQDARHEVVEDACDVFHAPALVRGRGREGEAGERGYDDVERGLPGGRIRQGLDQRVIFPEGACNAVSRNSLA